MSTTLRRYRLPNQAGIHDIVTGAAHTMSMSSTVSSPPRNTATGSNVVAINDDAALYLALAEAIRGAAVGLSPSAQQLLRRGLRDRFGSIFATRGADAVDELIRLANEPRAA